MVGIRARVGKLENASWSKIKRSAVAVMADGHSQEEISSFLFDNGVQQDGRQPIIIVNGGHGKIERHERNPLRMV